MNELAAALNPEDDYLTIVEADEKMSARAAERKKDLDEMHERLRSAFHLSLSPLRRTRGALVHALEWTCTDNKT